MRTFLSQPSVFLLLTLANALWINLAKGQELPTQYTVLEWLNDSNTPLQTCLSETTEVGDYLAIFEGRIYVEDDSFSNDDEDSSYEAAYVSYTDHTGTHRNRIDLYDTDQEEVDTNEWFEFLGLAPDWYIEADDLAHTITADSVWLEIVSSAQTAIWYNSEAAIDLLVQWVLYWCVDENDDDRCDLFTASDGRSYLPVPPIRKAEQVDLANCLDGHRNTKVVVAKIDYQISGSANYPKLAQWTANCPVVPANLVQAPGKIESPNTEESCLLFNYWLSGGQDTAPEYLCNPTVNPEDSELSGYQIRYQMDKALGEFPGFTCPEVEPVSTNSLTSKDLRFDNLGLQRPLRRGLGGKTPRIRLQVQ